MNAIAAGIADGFLVGEPAWTRSDRRGLFVVSALSSEGVLELVARHYDLDAPVTASLYRRAGNDSYVLMAGTKRFLLKIYRYNTRTREALLEEMQALSRLSARGVLVGTPVPRRDGELVTEILVPEGSRLAVLFDWVPGGPATWDATSVRKIGQALAQLHLAARDIKTMTSRPRRDLSRLFERPVACIQAKVADSPLLTEQLRTIIRKLVPHVDEAKASLRQWGFCHGDCEANNLYISGQDVGFLDFDWCGMGWQAYDLATFRWSGRMAGIDPSILEAAVAGYLDIRPEAAAAMRSVPLLSVLRQLWVIEQVIVDAVCAGPFMQSPEMLKQRLDFCARLALDLQ